MQAKFGANEAKWAGDESFTCQPDIRIEVPSLNSTAFKTKAKNV